MKLFRRWNRERSAVESGEEKKKVRKEKVVTDKARIGKERR